MIKYSTYFLILATLFWGCQQAKSPFTVSENGAYLFEADGGQYAIAAVSDDIIKVSYQDSITYGNRVYAPILTNYQAMDVAFTDSTVNLSTENVVARIKLQPFTVLFEDKLSGVKLREEMGYTRQADTTAFRFLLKEEEKVYGTGARALPLNRRGYAFQCYNQANYGYGMGAEYLNYSIPHVYSSEAYMLLIDNPAKAYFDIGKTEENIFEFASLGGNMAYYFINGNSFESLIQHYTELTGRQPLPPRWAFGHLQSRFGYRSAAQADSILNLALEAGYPVDAIILDIYWFGKELQDGKMGELSWDLDRWPQPKEMTANWAQKGVKTITVSEPFFTKKSKNYEYLDSNQLMGLDKNGQTMEMPNFYFGNAGLLDIFKPEARQWMWEQYKVQKAYGIDGWWVDLGEPEVHPDTMIHVNGFGREVHGVYGHEWTRMLYEGYAKDFPNERLFTLGRAGYAGSQRYGLLPWSGDVSRTWSGLQAQLPVMLGMGLSGIPYMHSDAGGFAGADRDSELYIRWMQFAVFSPVFRPHSNPDVPAEPVLWNEEVQRIMKSYLSLRYRMIPYNYTLGWRALATGMPFARPLFTAYEVSDTLSGQYLWGDALMIAPVTEPGKTTQSIFLPEGVWYDFWTNQTLEGGQMLERNLTLENIPVFARGGSLVTTTTAVSSTDDYSTEKLTLSYYLNGADFEASIYFDDGKTPGAYEKSQYQLLKAIVNDGEELLLSFEMEGDGYEGAPKQRMGAFEILGLAKEPSSVNNGADIDFIWDSGTGLLTFDAVIDTNKTIRIK